MASSEYSIVYIDNNTPRLAIDVSKRPVDWNPLTQKCAVFNMMTSDYIKFDIAKSAMQKAIRRGYGDEAVYWAVTMHNTAKQGRSNVWNRLLVIATEDVGIANIDAVSQVNYLHTTGYDDRYSIAQAAYLLSASPKSRLTDLCFHYYRHIGTQQSPDEIIEMITRSIQLPYEFNTMFRMIHGAVQLKMIRHAERDHAQEVKQAAIAKHIASGRNTKHKIKAKSTVNHVGRLIDNLLEICIHSYPNLVPYVNTSKGLRNGRGEERILVLIQLIVVISRRYTPTTVSTVLIDDRVRWLTDSVVNRSIRFNVPDYALDKHTSYGRKVLHRGLQHFLTTASVLNNRGGEWILVEDMMLKNIMDKLE